MSRKLIIISFTIVFLFAALLSATTVIELDLKGLVKASDLIVIGEVESTRVFMEKGRILTSVVIAQERVLKGKAADKIEIVQYGGRLDKLTTYVPGMPQFVEKEKVLLFLEKPQHVSTYVVTGLSQGKFKLATGPDGRKIFVVPTSLDGIALLNPLGLKKVEMSSPKTPSLNRVVQPLEHFSQQILELQK